MLPNRGGDFSEFWNTLLLMMPSSFAYQTPPLEPKIWRLVAAFLLKRRSVSLFRARPRNDRLTVTWKLLPICPLPLTSHSTGLYKPPRQPGATFRAGTAESGSKTWTTTRTISPPTAPPSLTVNLPVNQADPPWSTWATSARTLHGTTWCGRCATRCTWTSAAWDSWLWSTPSRWERELISYTVLRFEITRTVKKTLNFTSGW